jgi:hypothetical protein
VRHVFNSFYSGFTAGKNSLHMVYIIKTNEHKNVKEQNIRIQGRRRQQLVYKPVPVPYSMPTQQRKLPK